MICYLLVSKIWPKIPLTKSRKNLWAVINELRHTLGWADAVIARRGEYSLDENVVWEYDARSTNTVVLRLGEFLPGVYSDWVLDVGRELTALSNQTINHSK
jgi:hypothetical protein